MIGKYLSVFLVSMVPLVELRLAVPIAIGMGLDYFPSLIVCVLGNMLPVPLIYFFARKVLIWGSKKAYIGKICNFFLVKGERAGQKLTARTGRFGLFVALMLFVGIPIPGTGAWTGTLGASFLNMGIKSTALAVGLGVILAGTVMALGSLGIVHIFGLFVALMLFVGIPIPGTGAWTGTLGASFLNMGIKSTALAVGLGVILAGTVMALGSLGIVHIFGL